MTATDEGEDVEPTVVRTRRSVKMRVWAARAVNCLNPVSGLPRDVIPVIFLNLLEPWTINTIWPFLPAMVRNELGVDEERIGFASGVIGAAFFAGQAASGYIYGRLSDKVGRRPIMLFGAAMTAVFSFAFGFCTSLSAAVIVRFAGGALGGTSPVCKTYIGEVTTEENQAKVRHRVKKRKCDLRKCDLVHDAEEYMQGH